jgi:hypothetical protein
MWRTGSKFVCPSPAAIRRELPSSSRAGADPSLQDWLRPHHKRPPGRRAGSPVPGSPAEPAEAGAALGERNTDRKWIPRTLFATKREFNVNTTHATTGATALLLPAQRIRIRTPAPQHSTVNTARILSPRRVHTCDEIREMAILPHPANSICRPWKGGWEGPNPALIGDPQRDRPRD